MILGFRPETLAFTQAVIEPPVLGDNHSRAVVGQAAIAQKIEALLGEILMFGVFHVAQNTRNCGQVNDRNNVQTGKSVFARVNL